MGNDYSPYCARRGDAILRDAPVSFGEETNLAELPVSCSLDDYPTFEYLRLPNSIMPSLKTPAEVFGNWTGDAAYMLRDFTNGVLVVTFHPQVIGRVHRMLGLERWLDGLVEMGVAFERMNAVAGGFLTGRAYGEYLPCRTESR